jgi:hypothetical protein
VYYANINFYAHNYPPPPTYNVGTSIIRFYAPFCKACKAFGIKFRKLAAERGDRTNAIGDVIRRGDARFGEIEYSSNVRLCKNLSIKMFPAVIIYRGGERAERLSEIACKLISIEDIISEMDQLVSTKSCADHR